MRRCRPVWREWGSCSATAGLRLGVVGPVARACDIRRDVRHDHPYELFRFAHMPVSTAWAGDVLARTLVRWVEVQRSLDFVIEQLAGLPKGAIRVECGALHPDELVVAMSEGWRGEIVHVCVSGPDGRIRRHKVVDPSFHNWPAAGGGHARQSDLGFPALQQELQPLVRGA